MARTTASAKSIGKINDIDRADCDDNVTITICFCDKNCCFEQLDDVQKFVNFKRKDETAKGKELVKKKVFDCKQVQFPDTINILTDEGSVKSCKKSAVKDQPNKSYTNGRKKEYYGANGLQPCPKQEIVPKCQVEPSYRIFHSLPNPDVTVIINETEFKCSVELLKRYSKFFHELKIDKKCVIYLCGICVDEEIFSVLYTWMQMYFSEPWNIINENNIVDVLSACFCLSITDLEIKCWEMIWDHQLFTGEKAFKIYRRSTEKNFQRVTCIIFDRVIKYFPILLNTKGFLELKSCQLKPILSSDDLNSSSEMEIFLAACKWIMYDPETRMTCLPEIMNCVRFNLMPPEQLCSLHLLNVPENIKEIASHPHTVRKIEDSLVLNSLKKEYRYPKENCWEFWYKCKELGIEVANDRSSKENLQICFCHKN